MKAKLSVASVVLICFTLWSSISFAACANVVGTWNVFWKMVQYDSVNKTFSYSNFTGGFHVTNQKGCLFYGFGGETPPYDKPFTGSIRGTEVTIASFDIPNIISGQLLNPDPTTGKYKTISATMSFSDGDGGASTTWTMTRQ